MPLEYEGLKFRPTEFRVIRSFLSLCFDVKHLAVVIVGQMLEIVVFSKRTERDVQKYFLARRVSNLQNWSTINAAFAIVRMYITAGRSV